MEGRPTRLVFYLGNRSRLKVRVFSGDVNARADQVTECAADIRTPWGNAEFPAEPFLSTGEKIIGNDGGSLVTRFYREDGRDLSPQQYDWVEFRFWATAKRMMARPSSPSFPVRTKHRRRLVSIVEVSDRVSRRISPTGSLTAWKKAQAFRRLTCTTADRFARPYPCGQTSRISLSGDQE